LVAWENHKGWLRHQHVRHLAAAAAAVAGQCPGHVSCQCCFAVDAACLGWQRSCRKDPWPAGLLLPEMLPPQGLVLLLVQLLLLVPFLLQRAPGCAALSPCLVASSLATACWLLWAVQSHLMARQL
jgi:hypothetical protein